MEKFLPRSPQTYKIILKKLRSEIFFKKFQMFDTMVSTETRNSRFSFFFNFSFLGEK